MTQVITANRLKDGVVVFLGADSEWVERIEDAWRLAEPATTGEALEIARRAEANNLVLDVYAVEIAEKTVAIAPKALREVIRASGPTVHLDHGKQSARRPMRD